MRISWRRGESRTARDIAADLVVDAILNDTVALDEVLPTFKDPSLISKRREERFVVV